MILDPDYLPNASISILLQCHHLRPSHVAHLGYHDHFLLNTADSFPLILHIAARVVLLTYKPDHKLKSFNGLSPLLVSLAGFGTFLMLQPLLLLIVSHVRPYTLYTF